MLSREDRLKYEIAQELGLMEKLKEVGWAGLSAAESGRVGGLMAARKRNGPPGGEGRQTVEKPRDASKGPQALRLQSAGGGVYVAEEQMKFVRRFTQPAES